MNLYKISPSEPFLPIVADFIITNFDNKLDTLKVILPNFFTCINLQKILIQKKKITILPNIIPFSNIEAEGEEIFKISSDNISPITYLEEKIILAEIIYNYKELKFDINQSLKFSPLLAKLFYAFTYNNIPVESIQYLPTLNQASHWQFIYEFLHHAYQNLQQKIKELKKQDRATYQINMLRSAIDGIKQNQYSSVLVAGIFGDNIFSWNFLKNIANLPNGFIILPPTPNVMHLTADNIQNEDGLYCLKQLLKILEKNLSDFKSLGSNINNDNSILDKLLCINHSSITYTPSAKTNIKYIELDDIYQEAENICLICKQNTDKMIGIIVNNEKTKEFYCNFLLKYSLGFQDLLGTDLSKTNITNLIISITEILCSDFDIKKLFILCKNPLLDQSLVIKLEELLLGKNRLVSNTKQIFDIVNNTNDLELIEWYANLVNLLYGNDIDNKFNDILKTSIIIAEKLYPRIWLINKESYELSEYLAKLIEFKWDLILENKEDFPELFKSIISSARYFNSDIDGVNIIIGRTEDLGLLKFDLVLMVDFSEGNFPQAQIISPWLNQQMKDELNLDETRHNLSLYNFYMLLHNKEVIITRSKKQGNNRFLESSYMLKLKYILENSGNIIKPLSKLSIANGIKGAMLDYTEHGMTLYDGSHVQSKFFPNTISVTDIEMLMRSPYSFYAKKILNLKKYESIGSDPKTSEFGNFVHNVIEQYSKTYHATIDDKFKYILDISSNILNNGIFPLSVQKIWNTKFSAIAYEFIEFDEKRRNRKISIYSEVKGKLQMNFIDHKLTISSIADRIEVDDESRAIILDYKTGEIPLKKDVLSGKSPQLIIEALIALEEGFGMTITEVEKLIYVKISSSKPYIKLTEIELTHSELEAHKLGLKSFLEYYVTNKRFSMSIDLLKYNDYKHLVRRL